MTTQPNHETSNEADTVIAPDVIELTPSEDVSVPTESDFLPETSPAVAMVTGETPSMTTETGSLLETRLKAVTILALAGCLLNFAASLLGEGFALGGGYEQYQMMVFVRVLVYGALLGLLYTRTDLTNDFLRGIEYTLFGFLVLSWIYGRYHSIIVDAQAGNTIALLSESLDGQSVLMLVIVLYGLFIPNTWQATAKVVLTIMLAPVLVTLLVNQFHPEMSEALAPLKTGSNISTLVVKLTIASLIAIYGAGILNSMRVEVHQARKFGQYQLRQMLGKGGMGEVYLAEHALLKRPCALKLMRSEDEADPIALARFEREVQATASLTHPHIVDIYDYGHSNDGTFYYVMEYLPGLSLEQLISQVGPLSPERTIYLLKQTCSALAEAHEAGLIHRDLKPANLYVSERGGLCDFVKVLDFGLVKSINPGAAKLTADHVVSGTPHYMSPEQAAGESGLDARCDIYALGAIGYHMLTGQPPFDGDTAVAVMIAHASKEVVPPSQLRADIPEDLEQVILRCLEKQPDDRYANVTELEQALADCADADGWDSKAAAVWWQDALSGPQVEAAIESVSTIAET
ncbi:MAG: serine/threonine protein kinase [Planctomycetaceae bacterium]|nr:serine/threonine protein kinase [Planctomycetaceae bacterium]